MTALVTDLTVAPVLSRLSRLDRWLPAWTRRSSPTTPEVR